MTWNGIANKLEIGWSNGHLSWGGIAIAAVCVLIGILFYCFHIIDHTTLVLLSGLNVVAVHLGSSLIYKKQGRAFDSVISVLFALLYLLLL